MSLIFSSTFYSLASLSWWRRSSSVFSLFVTTFCNSSICLFNLMISLFNSSEICNCFEVLCCYWIIYSFILVIERSFSNSFDYSYLFFSVYIRRSLVLDFSWFSREFNFYSYIFIYFWSRSYFSLFFISFKSFWFIFCLYYFNWFLWPYSWEVRSSMVF